jgi:hypothetical protein
MGKGRNSDAHHCGVVGVAEGSPVIVTRTETNDNGIRGTHRKKTFSISVLSAASVVSAVLIPPPSIPHSTSARCSATRAASAGDTTSPARTGHCLCSRLLSISDEGYTVITEQGPLRK